MIPIWVSVRAAIHHWLDYLVGREQWAIHLRSCHNPGQRDATAASKRRPGWGGGGEILSVTGVGHVICLSGAGTQSSLHYQTEYGLISDLKGLHLNYWELR